MEVLKHEKFFSLDYLNENIPYNSCLKRVCIFGQGFVGLPLALSFSLRGCDVTGVDVDTNLVNNINNGFTSHTEKFYDIPIQDILTSQLENGRYKATTDAARAVKESRNIIVTVGIPIKDGKPIMIYLKNVCRVIGKNLKKNDLVVIRSTVIPGTTEEFILPILENESGMKAGTDFYLAYSSERIAEGKAFDEFANMPTLVGGINKESLNKAIDLLSVICKADIIPASCIKAVETSKVFENVQRDVNIAMSQEFARFTEALGIDIFEVIKLANTHKRVNLLTPGPGVGGYCIPNAYYYIAPKAIQLGIDIELLKLSRRKNADLPKNIVNKVEELLVYVGKHLNGSKIAILGLSMKDYSNDDRISPPVEICRLLISRGAKVSAYDPVVSTKYDFKVNSQAEALYNADALMILAKQKEICLSNITNIKQLMKDKPIIIDTKGIIDRSKLEKEGFVFWVI